MVSQVPYKLFVVPINKLKSTTITPIFRITDYSKYLSSCFVVIYPTIRE